MTGNNGLITKATNVKEKNTESEIFENIKLAYGEYQIVKHDSTAKTAEEIIGDSLKYTYGDNIIEVKVKNEKVTVNMKVNNIPKTYIYKANTDEIYEYVDLFDYKGKQKKELLPGDDITLGTEKFRVFYNKDDEIKVVPWYNIETKLDTPKQSETAGTVKFSTRPYWSTDEDGNKIENWNNNLNVIDISNDSCNLSKYINAYEKTLGLEKIEEVVFKCPTVGEIVGSSDIRNPGKIGNYWTTSPVFTGTQVYFITSNGGSDYSSYGYGGCGVRPIIIIEY